MARMAHARCSELRERGRNGQRHRSQDQARNRAFQVRQKACAMSSRMSSPSVRLLEGQIDRLPDKRAQIHLRSAHEAPLDVGGNHQYVR